MKEITKNTNDIINFNVIDLKDKFLNYIDNSEKTILSYEIAINQFIKWLNINEIKEPDRQDIINYREYLKESLKPTSVNSYLIAIKSFFKFLQYEGIYKNITENVKQIKLEQTHLKSGLSKEQVKLLLQNCDNIREELLLKLTLTCALRANEIINIQLKDFYSDSGVIMLKVLGKARGGFKQDSVKIDDKVYKLLLEYCETFKITDYLFTSTSNNNNGGKLNSKTLRRIFDKLLLKSGIDKNNITFHSIRHTYAELAFEQGFDKHEISKNMRHKSLNTTEVYYKEYQLKKSNINNSISNMFN